MKKLTLAFFLAINYSFGLAQKAVNLYTAKIDSVQNLLNKSPKEDTTKVKRLNDLALLCSFDMQFERSILAAKQARQLSKKLNYLRGEGLYLNFMGLISGNGFYIGYYYFNIKKFFV